MTSMSRQDTHPVKGDRSHEYCKEQYGVFRPGKTASDKARGSWAPKGVKARAATVKYNEIAARSKGGRG